LEQGFGFREERRELMGERKTEKFEMAGRVRE